MKPLRMMVLAGNPESLSPVAFTPPVWSYTDTVRICRAANPNYRHGRAGTARRDKLEIRVRAGLRFLEDTWGHGLEAMVSTRDGSVTLRDLLHRNVRNLPPYAYPLRSAIKALLSWLGENGPHRWARASVVPLDQRGPRSTPYQIPRRNEGAARGWLRNLRRLKGMLLNLASWWCRVVIPLLRGVSVSSDGVRSSAVGSGSRGVGVAVSRDQESTARRGRPAWLERATARWCPPEAL